MRAATSTGTTRTLSWVVVRAALVMAFAAPAAVLLDLPPAIRFVCVLTFILMVPGTSIMTFFPVDEAAVRAGIVIVTGMTVFAGEAVLMVWLNLWRPVDGLVALAVPCAIALAYDVLLRRRATGARR